MKDLLVSLTFYPLPIGRSFGGFLEPHLPRPPLRPNYMYFIFMGIFKKNEENQQIEMEQHMELLSRNPGLTPISVTHQINSKIHKYLCKILYMHSKTCLKWPVKIRQYKYINEKSRNGSLMRVKSIVIAPLGACSPWSILQYY